MNLYPRPLLLLPLFCMALFVDATLGQSLSIVRKSGGEFLIEATAPPEFRYVLQGSRNLHLWVDIIDEVRGKASYLFESGGVSKRVFRLSPWTPPPDPIIVVLLGDSTVADFETNSRVTSGWGQGIYGYFKPSVRVVNLAVPCQSTKVFLTSIQKTHLQAIKPGFVLVQFGSIDATGCGADAEGYFRTTLQEYAENLKIIIGIIREFNGTPILVTPPVPWQFDAKAKVGRTLPDRCAVIREVGIELQTPVIDLNQLTADLFDELGRDRSAYIPASSSDVGHYSKKGAEVVAGLVVNALPSALGPFLLEIPAQLPGP